METRARRRARAARLAAVLALVALPGARAAVDPAAEFARAREAYDAGDLAGAAARYEGLLREGYDAPELRFNLGNARFRAGDVPGAVHQYRLAQWMRPRDPDVAKNLRFALEHAGAIAPAVPPLRAAARRLSETEWTTLAAAAWGLAGAAFAAGFLARRGRAALRRAAAAAAVVALVAAAGALEWRDLRLRPEAVVLAKEAAVRFAPLEDATVHFTLPAGSIVRVLALDGGWRRVALDGREGWLPAEDVRPVRPAADASPGDPRADS